MGMMEFCVEKSSFQLGKLGTETEKKTTMGKEKITAGFVLCR